MTTAPVRPWLAGERGDDVALRLGREAAERVSGGNPELGGDPRHDGGVVAGEDPDADSARAERVDGPLRVGAERVADARDAGDAPVDGHEDGAEPLGDERLGPLGESGRDGGARGLDVDAVPDAHGAAVEPARRSPGRGPRRRPRRCRTTCTERPYEARKARATACDDSASSARASWSAASSPSQRRDRGPPLGERPGLVEEDGVDVPEPLEGVGVLDEDPRRARRA